MYCWIVPRTYQLVFLIYYDLNRCIFAYVRLMTVYVWGFKSVVFVVHNYISCNNLTSYVSCILCVNVCIVIDELLQLEDRLVFCSSSTFWYCLFFASVNLGIQWHWIICRWAVHVDTDSADCYLCDCLSLVQLTGWCLPLGCDKQVAVVLLCIQLSCCCCCCSSVHFYLVDPVVNIVVVC